MKNKSGLGIVQVLIATVMLGLLSVAAVNMISGTAKGQKSIQNAADFDILKASINQS